MGATHEAATVAVPTHMNTMYAMHAVAAGCGVPVGSRHVARWHVARARALANCRARGNLPRTGNLPRGSPQCPVV